MTRLEPLLARTMQPIVDAVGFDAAIAFVSRFGGTRVWLRDAPLPSERCPVVRTVGEAAAVALVRAIGAGTLEVPRCMTWLLARRNEEIVARYDGGESQSELALRFNVTARQVRNILREARLPTLPDIINRDLFTEETTP